MCASFAENKPEATRADRPVPGNGSDWLPHDTRKPEPAMQSVLLLSCALTGQRLTVEA